MREKQPGGDAKLPSTCKEVDLGPKKANSVRSAAEGQTRSDGRRTNSFTKLNISKIERMHCVGEMRQGATARGRVCTERYIQNAVSIDQ